jgi:uncharacterized protein YjiS (DUF1127 family)
MNAELINPIALLDCFSASPADRHEGVVGRPRRLWRNVTSRLREELRYRRALMTLNRLDDRDLDDLNHDLDDLNLGRGDLSVLARRHARAMAEPAQPEPGSKPMAAR